MTKQIGQQKFVDTLNIILSDFEAQTTKILNKRTPTYLKLDDLSLIIAYMRTNLYKSLLKLKNQLVQPHKSTNILQQQYKICKQSFEKMNLHHILKRKVMKLQKQQSTIIHQQQDLSSTSSPLNNQNQSNMNKLKNSIILIQADLGIETPIESEHSHLNYNNQTNTDIIDRLNARKQQLQQNSLINSENSKYYQQNRIQNQLDKSVSEVVHRSMASIQGTPIRPSNLATQQSILNQSITSNYYQFKNIIKKAEDNEQNNQQTNKKQNHGQNIPNLVSSNQSKPLIPTSTSTVLKADNKKIKKKTRATVYSSKDRILDNLLEQSYLSYQQNKQEYQSNKN